MRSIQGVLALVLALFSSVTMALGLGDIRVLSRPGQPFLAEIPVISSDPDELHSASVGLASPATFERVGLAPPQGVISELQFQFAQDREGRSVIRVSSATPVEADSLGFLIEVDWGQGRLVREYSALVAAPQTAAAVAEPVIEAPLGALPDRIARGPEPLPQAASPDLPLPAPEQEAAPVQAPPAAPVPPAPVSGQLAPVQRGQTLSHIARELSRQSGASLNQTMVALLRANPEAFIRGNIHLLKEGAVLRNPGQEELAQVDAAQARAVVREQTAQWRQARAPIPQPAVAGGGEHTVPSPENAPAPTGARLEIAPAAAGAGQAAGVATGLDAGGEGDMVASGQLLRQAQEDLAARDAELQELRERVGELEKLQQQQQALISMKDSDLAAAQQRLAEAGKRAGEASFGWLWLGLALLVLGTVGWLLSRRRKPLPPAPPARGFGREGLAAAMPPIGALAADEAMEEAMPADEAPEQGGAEPEAEVEAEAEAESLPAAAYEEPMPAWLRAAGVGGADPAPVPVADTPVLLFEASQPPVDGPQRQEAALAAEPADGQESAWLAEDMAAVMPLNPAPAGRERLELAIAYLDLGDAETARTLLSEVARGSDLQARAEALELLGRMG